MCSYIIYHSFSLIKKCIRRYVCIHTRTHTYVCIHTRSSFDTMSICRHSFMWVYEAWRSAGRLDMWRTCGLGPERILWVVVFMCSQIICCVCSSYVCVFVWMKTWILVVCFLFECVYLCSRVRTGSRVCVFTCCSPAHEGMMTTWRPLFIRILFLEANQWIYVFIQFMRSTSLQFHNVNNLWREMYSV